MESIYIHVVEYVLISPTNTAKHAVNSSYVSKDVR